MSRYYIRFKLIDMGPVQDFSILPLPYSPSVFDIDTPATTTTLVVSGLNPSLSLFTIGAKQHFQHLGKLASYMRDRVGSAITKTVGSALVSFFGNSSSPTSSATSASASHDVSGEEDDYTPVSAVLEFKESEKRTIVRLSLSPGGENDVYAWIYMRVYVYIYMCVCSLWRAMYLSILLIHIVKLPLCLCVCPSEYLIYICPPPSPPLGGKLLAAADSLGRVLLFDSRLPATAIRVWKGVREARFAWTQDRHVRRHFLYLSIHGLNHVFLYEYMRMSLHFSPHFPSLHYSLHLPPHRSPPPIPLPAPTFPPPPAYSSLLPSTPLKWASSPSGPSATGHVCEAYQWDRSARYSQSWT